MQLTYVSKQSSQFVDVSLVTGDVVKESGIDEPLGQCEHKLVGLSQILAVLFQLLRMNYQILIGEIKSFFN